MKVANLTRGIACGALVFSSSLFSGASVAGAEHGVRCPAGYSASYANGVMKCSKQASVAETRPSVCPLIPFVTTEYIQRPNEPDKCKRSDNGALVSTVIGGPPVFDPQNWQRQVDGASGGLDRFVKTGQTQTVYEYPVAAGRL